MLLTKAEFCLRGVRIVHESVERLTLHGKERFLLGNAAIEKKEKRKIIRNLIIGFKAAGKHAKQLC